jgi:hypothetical protein
VLEWPERERDREREGEREREIEREINEAARSKNKLTSC